MSTRPLYRSIALSASGATIDLYTYGMMEEYLISGSVTLVASYSISTTETPVENLTYKIWWLGSCVLNGNTFTMFGTSFEEQFLNKNGLFTFKYIGGSWTYVYEPTNSLADRRETIPVTVSFDTGEQGESWIYIPYDCQAYFATGIVTEAVANTDVADVTFKSSLGTMTGSLSFAISAPIGTTSTSTLTGANVVIAADTYLKVCPSKVTPGGHATISVAVIRD